MPSQLTLEEQTHIEKCIFRMAKAFDRGIWTEAYCIAQCEELSNQYKLKFTIIYDQFRKEATRLFDEHTV
jgi:hypothetical protein